MTEETETVTIGGRHTDEDGNPVEWIEEVTQPKGTLLREMHETMEFLSKLPPPTKMVIPKEIKDMIDEAACEQRRKG